MSEDLNWLNELSPIDAARELLKCCGSRRWASEVAKQLPFASLTELNKASRDAWWSLDRDDWLEAFRSHPKIGERKAESEGSAETQEWSEQEQSAIAHTSSESLEELASLNREYEERFGYIFIVCASGRSSEEMLSILRGRLKNDPNEELPIAAAEQAKITELRLAKLLGAN